MITLKPESPSGHDLALLETVEFKWYRVCGLILAKWTDFLCQRDTLSEATVTLRTVVTFVTWNRVSSLEAFYNANFLQN